MNADDKQAQSSVLYDLSPDLLREGIGTYLRTADYDQLQAIGAVARRQTREVGNGQGYGLWRLLDAYQQQALAELREVAEQDTADATELREQAAAIISEDRVPVDVLAALVRDHGEPQPEAGDMSTSDGLGGDVDRDDLATRLERAQFHSVADDVRAGVSVDDLRLRCASMFNDSELRAVLAIINAP
jgi:hypothetical protein